MFAACMFQLSVWLADWLDDKLALQAVLYATLLHASTARVVLRLVSQTTLFSWFVSCNALGDERMTAHNERALVYMLCRWIWVRCALSALYAASFVIMLCLRTVARWCSQAQAFSHWLTKGRLCSISMPPGKLCLKVSSVQQAMEVALRC